MRPLPAKQTNLSKLCDRRRVTGDLRKHPMGFYVLSYLCIAVFIGAAGCLIYGQITLPLHVRWEIYPVQHETTTRSAYGGSYMEEVNWWNNKYKSSSINELKYMVPEILFLRGVWKGNRLLWCLTFPFHFGLYLILATFGFMVLYAVLSLWTLNVFAAGGPLRIFLDVLIASAGWSGIILGGAGSLALLHKRLSDREWRDYSSFSDYFNISFILIFFLAALAAGFFADPWFEGAKAYTYGLLTGGQALNDYIPPQSISGAAAIISASLLIAYIPLTHMSHMFMKYFLYHNVKWDDAPNRPGGRMEAAIKKNLELKPTWEAKHVGADGHKSWGDIASLPPEEKK
jgi:nitrate reductase gamma subunit